MTDAVAAWRIALLGLASLALAIGVGRFAFTPLLPMMLADELLDLTEGGWLAAAHFAGYLAGALTAAMLPLGPRLLLTLALCGVGAGALAMAATESMALWLVLRFAVGAVSAWTLTLVSHHCVARLAALDRTTSQGWVFAGVGVGIAAAGLACLGFMAAGWKSPPAWAALGGVGLAAALALAFGPARNLPNQAPKAAKRDGARAALDWPSLLAYGAMGFGYIVPATYLPLMARASAPDPLVFGWVWPVFGAAAASSTILAARLWRHFDNRSIWIAGQLAMAAGVAAPAIYPHLATVVAAGLAVGGTFMVVTMAGMKEAHLIAPPSDALRHIGALTAAFAFGQILGPIVAAWAHGATGGFAAPLAGAAALLAASACLLLRPRPTAQNATSPAETARLATNAIASRRS